ncbi:DEAD/DEAH box helicase family protein, partial [bacterium]|nr:DEAD/DEAH box helicase family protein [bacterium]
MARRKEKVIEIKFQPFEILHPEQRKKSQAYLVNKLRDAVFNWRNSDYPNVTRTTRRLLEFWFKEDHIVENKEFKFWFVQREAIETLIYVYEVMRKRKFAELMQDFGEGRVVYNPEIDQYPLYCFKMATGTGKTFVMTFAVVWSYFNYKFEGVDDYTNKFLLITPNVIVYERLKRDFQDGKIFRQYPFIPDEWKPLFDLKVVLRDDPIPSQKENIFFLTNIQQLEERQTRKRKIEKMVEEGLGLPEVIKTNIYQENRIREVLNNFSNVMILKDEAHHIYNVEKA